MFLINAFFLTSGQSKPHGESGSDALIRFTYTEYHMGVDTRLVVYAKDQPAAEAACAAAFSRIAELDTMMSDYRADSELSRLSNKAAGSPVRVSSELFKVLRRAQLISRRSDGAFDVTVGPLVRLWRAARKTGKLPTPAAIRGAKHLVGWKKLRLNTRSQTVELKVPGMRLDLGAIGKGYAADEALRVLNHHGIGRALVDIGDIALGGPPPGKEGWTISVPDAEKAGKAVTLLLSHCAVSSSGDAFQHVVIGGVEYSHVVDPRTGIALTNRVQATVIARDGFTSDPLSTCMTLLTPAKRARLLRAYPGVKVYVRVLRAVE